jgi:hypothetical protein
MRQISAIESNLVTPHGIPLVARFGGKLVLDILPAALASVIGGFLLTQYQFGHTAPRQATAEQGAPASAEMMRLVRDEHAVILDYLKTETAAEKSRLAVENAEDARAAAEAKAAEARAAASKAGQTKAAETKAAEAKAAEASRRLVAAALSQRPVGTHNKAITVAALPSNAAAPLPQPMVAQTEPAAGAAVVEPPKPAHNSLFAKTIDKTIDVKDHVVAAAGSATWTVVSAIGGLPSWIASMGGRIGGASANSAATNRMYSAAS